MSITPRLIVRGKDDPGKEGGVNMALNIAGAHAQNGRVEGVHLTMLSGVRTLLSQTGLTASFWAEQPTTLSTVAIDLHLAMTGTRSRAQIRGTSCIRAIKGKRGRAISLVGFPNVPFYIFGTSRRELERLLINHDTYKRSLGGYLLHKDMEPHLAEKGSDNLQILDCRLRRC